MLHKPKKPKDCLIGQIFKMINFLQGDDEHVLFWYMLLLCKERDENASCNLFRIMLRAICMRFMFVLATLGSFVESFQIFYNHPSGLFCEMWFKCEKGIFSIVRKRFLESPHIPHSVLSTHTHCTLTSAGASAYFITTFVQKILALNQMSNHVKFFALLCHFFMSRKVPRHFRAISWRWLSFPCIDKKAQIFTLPPSCPPAKCCHLSMCARHIFLDSLARSLLVELKWV